MTAIPHHEELQTTRLRIEGMHCAACVGRVEQALIRERGVRSAEVSLAGGTALVRGSALDADALARAVRSTGYVAEPVVRRESLAERREAMERRHLASVRRWRSRVLVGGAIWLPLELLHWFGHHVGIQAHAGPWLWATVIGATAALLYVGSAFYLSAFRAALARSTNMDTLVAIGATAAFALSAANLIRMRMGAGDLPLYFTEAAGLLTLIGVGHWLEASMTARAGAALRELLALQPEEVTRLRDASARDGDRVRSEDVLPGDLLLVRPGERVAIDGEIVEGSSSLDESVVTGESIPADRAEGDAVIAGSMNLTGRLVVRATSDGASTTIARMAEVVLNAQSSKTRIQRLADKVSSIFVPAVLGIALVTLLGWTLAGDWLRGVISATTVLVISCPCALGLATPTAVMVGSGAASRRGILVRSAAALERTAVLRAVAFDKTGTLTLGRPRVVEADDVALALAAALAHASMHPLSVAIVEAARERRLPLPSASGVEERPGIGLAGMVEGRAVEVLSTARAEAQGLALPTSPDDASVSAVVRDGVLVGLIAFRDEPREEAPRLLEWLRAEGLETHLLSGDRPAVARSIGARLGIDPESTHGGLSPEEKVARVTSLARMGPLAMIGDGINDAAALAQAGATGGVGIAIGTGSNVAIESADVVIPGDRIGALRDLREIGTLTLRTIRQNLALSFGYNVLAIPAAAFGLLGVHGPIIAALAMALSDVSVIGNSLRLAARLRRRPAPRP
ncbi:MAG TPA: cation-translocating P-type ATPase [Phycisphaerales bacterium]|nr:cation-translocating P-type ATPase [Phycisphaerales bacterium]